MDELPIPYANAGHVADTDEKPDAVVEEY